MNRYIQSYFKYHVVARVKCSPMPSSDEEARYIYNNFKALGNLEHFSLNSRTDRKMDHDFTLVYNPARVSALTPFSMQPGYKLEPPEILELEASHICQELSSLIALPRYSFVSGNEDFLRGRRKIEFRYSLTQGNKDLENAYLVSPSSGRSPFCRLSRKLKTKRGQNSLEFGSVLQPDDSMNTIELRQALKRYRSAIRHNFQKFHVFNSITILNGIEGLKSVGAEVEPSNSEDYIVDIMNFK